MFVRVAIYFYIHLGSYSDGLLGRFEEFRRTHCNIIRSKAPTGGKGKQSSASTPPNDGEDAISYEGHVKATIAEYCKVKPNEGIVTELITITFRQRREVEKAMLVSEVLLKFPFLHHYEQVNLNDTA